jgi:ribosomal protein L19E
VHFAGHIRKTNKHGRATMRIKIRHAGLKRATVTRPGLLKGKTTVRVRKRWH